MIDSTSYSDNCLVVSLPMDVRNVMRGFDPHPINSSALGSFLFPIAFWYSISSLALPILTELEQHLRFSLFFNWASAEYTLSTVKPSSSFIIYQYSLNRPSYVSRSLKSIFSCNDKKQTSKQAYALQTKKRGNENFKEKKKPLKMNNYTTRGN